ncbi:MAG TPA: sigma-70 family RNA polymerase sigma factor [bacterium]|nr:sigma-70 family RNA polymerase sigma factor [bacterium]
MTDFRQAGDFQAFVTAHRGLWFKLAFRVLEDREEAEDVVQETLAFLWEKRQVLSIGHPGAYVARAVWLNSIKRRTRRRLALSLDEVPEPAAGEAQEPEEWDPRHLEEALGALPPAQQTVVRMKYYMGLTFKEIGETLKISLHTAASRCRYALAAMGKDLEGRANPAGKPKGPRPTGGKG